MFTNAILNRALEKVDELEQLTPQFNRYQETKQPHLLIDHSLNRNLGDSPFSNHTCHAGQMDAFTSNHEQSFCEKPALTENHGNIINTESKSQGQLTMKPVAAQENQEEGSEFLMLKNQMLNIEKLAIRQINKLKLELSQKEQQIDKLVFVIKTLRDKEAEEKIISDSRLRERGQGTTQFKEIGIQTENDLREEEIKSLKEALVRHIRINKQLTKKSIVGKVNDENNQKTSNLLSSIEKLVSKIEI